MHLQVAQFVPATEAEGPGRRAALWLQGCPLRCPGCCNPEMLPFEGGQRMFVGDVLANTLRARDEQQIEGLTLLGGEPFAHAEAAADLAAQVQQAELSVMVFSGFTLAELRAQRDPHVERLLAHTDLLVDGPYICELPETRRRWIGSANQQIHFLTSRYQRDEACWQFPNTLELRLERGELTVNGYPAQQAKDFWRRLPGTAAKG
jgi:anaerobic ribonucleoside-triphosphate reductase activating protein